MNSQKTKPITELPTEQLTAHSHSHNTTTTPLRSSVSPKPTAALHGRICVLPRPVCQTHRLARGRPNGARAVPVCNESDPLHTGTAPDRRGMPGLTIPRRLWAVGPLSRVTDRDALQLFLTGGRNSTTAAEVAVEGGRIRGMCGL